VTATQIPTRRSVSSLGDVVDTQRERLIALRGQMLAEQADAVSPAVARALEMADAYVFLALGYLGHVDELFPGELSDPR
jgi:hypothetical protein